MKLSKQGEYGLRAMLYFAARQNERRVQSRMIAEKERISVKFLEQILRRLRQTGLLVSQSGARGGYSLARPADKITIAEVIRAVDGPLAPMLDGKRLEQLVEQGNSHSGLYSLLLEVRNAVAGILERTTLMEVLKRTEELQAKKHQTLMYHI